MAITGRPYANGTGSEQLSPEHFKLLFTLDGKKIGAYESELKALIAEKNALIQKNTRLKVRIKAMEPDRAELVRLKKEQAAAAAQKRKEEEEKALYEALQEVDTSICRTDMLGVIWTTSHSSGTIVTKGEIICTVFNFISIVAILSFILQENKDIYVSPIKAKRDGKLFF